jgi:DNA-binding protein H-NS
MAEPKTKKLDLSTFSLAELRELATAAETLIAEKETGEKVALAAEIERITKEWGFAVSDILPLFPGLPVAQVSSMSKGKGKKSKGGRGIVAPKYRNPADPSQTWSGRGRQPVWLVAHLANGGTVDSVAIPTA